MKQQKFSSEHVAATALVRLAVSAERKKIAASLHDHINGLICSAKLRLHMIQGTTGDISLQPTMQLLDDAAREIRNLSHGIEEAENIFSLKDALLALQPELQADSKTRFSFLLPDGLPLLDGKNANALYLIIRELLWNVRKHAQAKNCKCILRYAEGIIKVIVTDDGIGFSETTKNAGIGLKIIKRRLQAMQGKIAIHTLPGQGCITTFSILI